MSMHAVYFQNVCVGNPQERPTLISNIFNTSPSFKSQLVSFVKIIHVIVVHQRSRSVIVWSEIS